MELWHDETGEGPPALLIHAGICDSRMWDGQLADFTRAHRTVRCDLRGFGRTPLPAGTHSSARDVITLLEALGGGPTSLVGASFGGRVALEVAIARPDLVGRLVLAGASIPGHEWSAPVRAYGDEEDAALERGDLDAAVEANLRFWVDGPERGPADVDPSVREHVGRMQRRALELQLPVWEEADERPLVPDAATRLGELEAPTLVITGALDVADIHAMAEQLATGIAAARMEAIPEAAHLPSMERPEEFNGAVLAFLAEGAP